MIPGRWKLTITRARRAWAVIFSLQPSLDQNGGVNIAVGQAVEADFVAVLATNFIYGSLLGHTGHPITNVQVQAAATIGGQSFYQSANTDNNGNYSIAVGSGSLVRERLLQWLLRHEQFGHGARSGQLRVSFGHECHGDQCQCVGEYRRPAAVRGRALSDFGRCDQPFPATPSPKLQVHANDGVGDNLTATTDGGGHYAFNVGNGSWAVSLDCNGLNAAGLWLCERRSRATFPGPAWW